MFDSVKGAKMTEVGAMIVRFIKGELDVYEILKDKLRDLGRFADVGKLQRIVGVLVMRMPTHEELQKRDDTVREIEDMVSSLGIPRSTLLTIPHGATIQHVDPDSEEVSPREIFNSEYRDLPSNRRVYSRFCGQLVEAFWEDIVTPFEGMKRIAKAIGSDIRDSIARNCLQAYVV